MEKGTKKRRFERFIRKPRSVEQALKEIKSQNKYPGTSRVTQRTKKDFLTIEGVIDNINLKVIVSPEDLEKLGHYFLDLDAGEFETEFYHNFIQPALWKLKGKKLRGRYAKKKSE